MMTDSLKFGPEWLRSSGGTNTSTQQRFPLAEFRYGREEMLSLFDKSLKVPEILPKYKSLFVEKIQCPLALTPSTDDDQMQQRSWQIRSSPGVGSLSTRGSRGGMIDRGRGRVRSTYLGGYQRPSSMFDEEGGRGIGRGERWTDRNGTDGEWSGLQSLTSPRKEYNSHGRGSSLESWRRIRTDEEMTPTEQWRGGTSREKWGRSTSWREEEPNANEPRMYNDRSYGQDRSMSGRSIPSNRKTWDGDDNLPEWAVVNPLESGGSFDASGAFHGSDDDVPNDDNDPYENEKELLEEKTKKESEELEKSNKSDGVKDLTLASRGLGENEEEPEVKAEMDMTVAEGSVHEQISVIVTTSTTIISSSTITTTTTQHASIGELSEGVGDRVTKVDSVDRMQEVADDMVEKLIMDDELMTNSKGSVKNQINRQKLAENIIKGPPANISSGLSGIPMGQEDPKGFMWFYRDPQDMVQGPFTSVEMAEWYEAGYFDDNLCVRRTNDQRFSKLGDLIELCGGEMPFFAPYRVLPLQLNEPQMKAAPNVPPLMPPPKMNPILDMESNINYQILRQHYILKQQALIYQKLSTSDMWHMLSSDQQRQMINKHMAQINIPDLFGLQAANVADSPMVPFGLTELMTIPNKQPIPPNQIPPSLDNNVDIANILDSAVLHEKKINHMAQPGGIHFPQGMPTPPQSDFGLSGGNSPGNPLNQLIHNMRMFPPQPQPNTPLNPLQHHPNSIPPMMHSIPVQSQPPNPSDLFKNDVSNTDRIKNLLLQLSMQKGMQQQMPPPPQSHPPSGGQIMPQHLQIKPNMLPNSHWFNNTNPADQLKAHGAGGIIPSDIPPPGSNWMPGNNNGNSVIDPVRAAGSSIWDLEQKMLSQAKSMEMKADKRPEELLAMPNIMKEEIQNQEIDQRQRPPVDLMGGDNNQWQTVTRSMDHMSQSNAQKMDSVREMSVLKKDEALATEKGNKKNKDSAAKAGNKSGGKVEMEEKKRGEENKRKDSQQSRAGDSKGDEKKENVQSTKGKQSGNKSNSSGQNNSSKAPWSIKSMPEMPGLSLAEIQKMELEQQRAEQSRLEHLLQQQQQWFDVHNLKSDPVLPKWNAPQIGPSIVKSLAEIQAEEQAKLRAEQENAAQAAITNTNTAGKANSVKKASDDNWSPSTVHMNTQSAVWSSMKLWDQQHLPISSGFWDNHLKLAGNSPNNAAVNSNSPAASGTTLASSGSGAGAAMKNNAGKTIAKSQTMSSIQTKSSNPITNSSANSNNNNAKAGGQKQKPQSNNNGPQASTSNSSKKESHVKGGKGNNKKEDANGQEFTLWCTKTLSAMNSTVDIPTFVSFLQDIESPYEVKDYIRLYLGETKECSEFAKHFLERRSKYKNQIRAQNAHVDDMCSPAPAITPSSDFQEGKSKKVKKNKMMKLDSRILGFSVTAAQDRLNVGDRDYPNAS